MSYRNTYIDINLDNFIYNINIFNKDKYLIAAIKANGYGLDDYFLANTLIESNVLYLAVSSLDEAMSLINKGISGPIMILGYVDSRDIDIIRKYDITLVTTSYKWVKDNCHLLDGIKIHIKINTGMNRLGLNSLLEINDSIKLLNKSNIEGIFTHLSSSDIIDSEDTNRQYQLFKDYLDNIDYQFKYIHISNTDGYIINDDICNTVRIGKGLLGLSSTIKGLKPVVSLYTHVVNCQYLKKGTKISYGGNYILDKDSYVITLPIGYADGLNRKHTLHDVYIDGEYGKIIGNICMDLCMVMTDRPYDINQRVELFGHNISIEEFACRIDTIVYEILVLLSQRLNRYYYKGNDKYELLYINKRDKYE